MLNINVEGLRGSVKPVLNDAVKNLTDANTYLGNVKLPSDFQGYSLIQSAKRDISSVQGRIKDIGTWVDKSVSNFEKIEGSNKSVMSALDSRISTFAFMNNPMLAVSMSGLNDDNEVVKAVKKTTKSAINYFKSGEFANDAKSFAKKTGAKVAKTVKSGISFAISTGAKFGKVATKVISGVESIAGNAMNYLGTKASSAFKMVHEKVLKPAICGIEKTAASVANATVGVVKGGAKLVEGLGKTVLLAETAVGAIGTGAYDIINTIINGKQDGKIFTKTGELFKATMATVATDYVGSAFKSFYEKTSIGKFLDNMAFKPFKSEGVVTNVADGIGYTLGVAVLSVATAGLFGVSTGLASAGTAGLSSFGNYTGEEWNKMKESVADDILKAYRNGEMTEAQYNSYVYVSNLSDAEWNKIRKDYTNGKISEDEYFAMKKIKDATEWRTLKNGLKGVGYGAASGVWEGVQWYLGGKLNNLKVGNSETASAVARVAIDSGFNAIDTPYRALLDVMFTNKSYEEAWADQGGWQGLLTNLGIGLVGSVGGEVIDARKTLKNVNEKDVFDATKRRDIVYTKSSLLDEIKNVGEVEQIIDDGSIAFPFIMGLDLKVGDIEVDDSLVKNIQRIKNLQDVSDKIDEAINNSLKKQNIEVTQANIQNLKKQIENGNFDSITEDNGYRKMVEILTKGKEMTAKNIKEAFSISTDARPSNQKSLELVIKAYEESIDNGNMGALLKLNSLAELKRKIPDFRFIDGDENATSHYRAATATVLFDGQELKRRKYGCCTS